MQLPELQPDQGWPAAGKGKQAALPSCRYEGQLPVTAPQMPSPAPSLGAVLQLMQSHLVKGAQERNGTFSHQLFHCKLGISKLVQ
jgi:hypothetical protein